MTIGEYAKLVGVQRDTIHKRIQRGEKLAGVTKMEKTTGGVNILHVDKEKATPESWAVCRNYRASVSIGKAIAEIDRRKRPHKSAKAESSKEPGIYEIRFSRAYRSAHVEKTASKVGGKTLGIEEAIRLQEVIK